MIVYNVLESSRFWIAERIFRIWHKKIQKVLDYLVKRWFNLCSFFIGHNVICKVCGAKDYSYRGKW